MGVKLERVGLSGEIAQSVDTLLHTPVGTLVHDREYGIDLEGLDRPPQVAEALMIAELEEKLGRYEPRVRIEEVTAVVDSAGMITFKVVMAYAGESAGAERFA